MTNPNRKPADDLLWRHLKTLPAFRAILRAIEARFYHQIDLPEPTLDLGCGDGNFAELTFNEYGRQLTVGLDPWWNPLNKSRRGEIYQDGVTQSLGDNMPFPSNHFASAISNSVLEHIPDIQPVLNETGRVLQIGGRFVITMPNHRFTEQLAGAQLFEKIGISPLADQYRNAFNFISRHAHTRSVEWWAARLATAGMQIERWQYYFSPKALHALEVGHAQGLPSAIIHALTNQWILAPTEANLALIDRWLRPFYLEQARQDDEQHQGTYLIIIARKVADHAVQPDIPQAHPFEVDPTGNLISENKQDLTPLAADPIAPPSPPLPTTTSDQVPAQISQPDTRLDDRPSIKKKIDWLTVALYLAGFICSFSAYTITSTTPRPFTAIFLWLSGIAISGYALWPAKTARPNLIEKLKQTFLAPEKRLYNLFIPLVLFVLALALRVLRLNEHPFILSGTEANIALDAISMFNGRYNPFATGTLTNPVLPLYLYGLRVQLLGRTPFAIRIVSALIGSLTIPLLYFITKKLWRWETALFAAIFLAGTHTHIHYSRLALTNIWDPLILLLTFFFLIYAWQPRPTESQPPEPSEKPSLSWVFLGITIGLSAYFFTTLHTLPLLLLGFLLFQTMLGFRTIQHNMRGLTIAFGLALIIALPTIRFYRAHPGIYMDRANTYGIFQTNWIIDEAVRTNISPNALLIDQFQQALTAFTHTADTSLYYAPNQAIFGPALALFWLIGVLIALGRFQKIRYRLLILSLVTVITFAGALLLSPPASHRYVIILPIATLIAALPFDLMLTYFQERWEQVKHPALRAALLAALAIAVVAPETAFYFRDYQQSHQFADRNTEIAHRLGEYLALQSTSTTVYFYGAPVVYTSFPTLQYLAPDFIPDDNFIEVLPEQATTPHLTHTGSRHYIVLPEREAELQAIQTAYPNGRIQPMNGQHATPLFTIYVIDSP